MKFEGDDVGNNIGATRSRKLVVIGIVAIVALVGLAMTGVNPLRMNESMNGSERHMALSMNSKGNNPAVVVGQDNTLQQTITALRLHFGAIVSEHAVALRERGVNLAVGAGIVHTLYYLNGGNGVDDILLKTRVGHVRKAKFFGYVYPELEIGETELSASALSNRQSAIEDRDREDDFLPGNLLEDTYEFFDTTAASDAYIRRLWTTGPVPLIPPRFANDFEDMTSDAAMAVYGFFSLASHLMKRVGRGISSDSSDGDKKRSNDICRLYDNFSGCDGVVYCLDLTANSPFEVRAPYVRYGAIAFYSEEKKIIGIYVSHLDAVVLPSDSEWEHAKYVLKTSGSIQVTAKDHLVDLHFIYGTEIVTASREILPLDHPLARLLAPHMFNVASVVFGTPGLLGYKQFFHQTFALTFDSIYEQHNVFGQQFKFETYPETLRRNGMSDEDPREFGPVDGLKLYDIIGRYVRNYLRIYYPNKGDLIQDADLVKFFDRVSVALRLKRRLDFDFFVDVITQFIFSVSGMHENVGGVIAVSRKDDQGGTRIRAGQTRQDLQALVELSAVAVLVTGDEPKLKDDYSKVFLDDAHKSAVLAIYGKFRQDLVALENDIDELNRQRPPVHNYLNFSPKYAGVTVSI